MDALAGVTWQHTVTHLIYTVTERNASAQTTTQSTNNFSYNQSSLAVGPTVRYTFRPGLELTLAAPVNYTLAANYSNQFSDHLFSDHFYTQVLAGFTYHLGP